MVQAGTDDLAIDVTLRRRPSGIVIRVQVKPEIEAFFERWSGGVQERPSHGRLWRADAGPAAVWALNAPQFQPTPTRQYSLVHSGAGFLIDNQFINISFLRLVGASAGREIVVETVMGRSELMQVAQRISDASHQFYAEYLQPITLHAYVGVQQLPTGVAA